MAFQSRSAAPALVAGATVLLGVTSLLLALTNADSTAELLAENRANQWLGGLAFGMVGALVLHAQAGNRLGPVMATSGLLATVGSTAAEYAALDAQPGTALPAAGLAAWAASTLWFPSFLIVIGGLPLLFPDGRLPSPRWRPAASCALVAGAVATLALWTSQAALEDGGYPDLQNPLDLPVDDDTQLLVALGCLALVAGVGGAAALRLVWGLRGADHDRRQQSAWFVAAVLLGGFGALLPAPDLVQFALSAAAVACLAVGVVRHRLFAIEVALSRAVVYALLTAGALVAYGAAVALLGASTDADVVPALVAAAAALVLADGRQRVQTLVERAMYGQRNDPVDALTGLGERLSAAVDSDDVLPSIVDGVRRSLNLPFAEVRFANETMPACSSGDTPKHTAQFDLVHAGQEIGALVVGMRRGETTLSEADARLLRAFARQAGVAAHGVQVARELRRSRERVVLSREEERQRLRRDLHDGLGPTLAGISLGLEQAEKVAARDVTRTRTLLVELRGDATACVDEVRRIVADLRPPALDQGGLAEALRRHSDLLTSRSNGDFVVTLEDRAPPDLPPAVEVAAYRIATEAITNTVRHASAHTCRIDLAYDGPPGGPALQVTVTDDGNGTPPDVAGTGTGLESMRERAEELGGTCTVTFRPGLGTRVEAILPTSVVTS
jgi:signal transduction histidine kinase